MTFVSHLSGVASSFCLLSWLLFGFNNPVAAEHSSLSSVESQAESQATSTKEKIAQTSPQNSGAERAPRLNYVGIGGTLGLVGDGETELGDGGFSIMSRTSFTNVLSLHTASVIGGDSYSSFALTGSFPVGNRNAEQRTRPALVPFAGAGIGVTFDDFDIDPMATAGVDIPITDSLTGTTRINANFGEEGTDIGLVLGVGIRLF